MRVLSRLSVPSLLRARAFQYTNQSTTPPSPFTFFEMGKRKRSTAAVAVKETPALVPEPTPSQLIPTVPVEHKSSPVSKPATKRRAQPKPKAQPVEIEPTIKAEKGGVEGLGDPEAEGDELADEDEIKEALSRPPPVNSDYLPLPWKGRLGYVS
jgi:hypothetical protein